MGSRAKSSKNSRYLENIQDRTLFLRKLSQENHVRRMNLARDKGEPLQANFVKPSNFSKLESKPKPQKDSVVDSKPNPVKRTDAKDSKRYPYDYINSSTINSNCKTNEFKVPRRKFSPFAILNSLELSRKAFCFPEDKSRTKFPTQSQVETPKKLFKYGEKTYKKKYIKEKPIFLKSNKKESPRKNNEDKNADNYQQQKSNKPPRLKNMPKPSKRKVKLKIPDLAYEQGCQYLDLCKGFIRSKTSFDERKVNIYSPEIPRHSFKSMFRNAANLKPKKTFPREIPHTSSGDCITVLNEYTQTDITGKKCSSSEINLLCERPVTKIRSSSLDPQRSRNRKELSPAPLKSKIPIALNRIKQVKDSDKTDKVVKRIDEKQRQKTNYQPESKRGEPVSKIKRNANRKSLHDKFSEKQKSIQAETEKKAFKVPFPSNAGVSYDAKANECYEAPFSESGHVSDYNLTDWSEFVEKFDQEYKKNYNLKADSTDPQSLNENKTSDNGLKYFKNKEIEKYLKDFEPSYDFLQSPIEKLMEEIKSAINTFNTDDTNAGDETQSNLSVTTTGTPEKGQKKKKVKKGRTVARKKKTLRRGKA